MPTRVGSAAAPQMFPSASHPVPSRQPTVTNSSASLSPYSSSSSSSASARAGFVIITLLVIVSIALCLLFRHKRRQTRLLSRRGAHHSLGSSPLHHLPSAPGIIATSEEEGDAATKSLIGSLPLFTFSSVTRPSGASASSSSLVEADCAICLSRFVSRDALRLLPLCCHAFHSRCIDPWLSSGHETCPLCRSDIYSSFPSILLLPTASPGTPNGSFRLELGSVSRRRDDSTPGIHRSYSIGSSFDYVVETEAEVPITDREEDGVRDASIHVPGGGRRRWHREYMDTLSETLSSRTTSFRSCSLRFLTGNSSRRSEGAGVVEWDIEASRVREEIDALFRWATGV